MRDSGKVWSVIVQLLVALLLLVSTGEAAVHKLVVPKGSGNTATYASIDDTTPNTGLYSWMVDATERVFQQWFWYRVGPAGPEAALDTLELVSATKPTPTSLSLLYRKPGVFDIQIDYVLTVYPMGEARSSIKKTVTITNISTSSPLDFHLFEYSDFDITSGLPLQSDNVDVVNGKAYQSNDITDPDGSTTLVHSSTLPPSSFEIDFDQSDLLPKLKDDSTTLLSSPQIPYLYGEDMQFGYQWDMSIPANGKVSFDIVDLVEPTAPLTATKTHSGSCVSSGGQATYTFTYDNVANILPVNNVKLIDMLPKNTTFVSATNGGVYDPVSRSVTWSLGNLAPGAGPQTVQATLGIQSGTDITNEVIAASDNAFPARATDLAVLCNHPPTITSTPVSTASTGIPYTYQVKGSDVDAGDTLQYSLAAKPAGMSIDPATGLITWTPTLAQVGSHQVSVVVTDSGSLTATQNFSITVIKPNSAPVISSPANNATLCAYSLQIEASDPDGDPLLYSFATPNIPLGMSMSANGLITWTNPSSALVGQVVPVTVQVLDSKWASSQVTINFSVSTSCAGGANFAPAAVDDMYSVAQGATLNIPAPGVLGNDYDVNGNTLTSTVSASPAKGKVTLNSNGSFTYVPNAGVTGSDTFRYRVSDGVAESIATVTINFTTAANQPPAAVGDAYSVNQDATLTVAAPGVLGNDTDADNNSLTAILVSSPANGTLTLNANGSFTYTPNAGFVGADSFSYKASDGTADSSIATVALTVNKVNKAPVAADDYYSVTQDSTLTVAATTGVLKNDSDPNGDGLTAVLVAGPSHGTVTLNDIGSFVYVPSAGYAGADSFTYKANDGVLDSAVATVFITVIGKGASTVTITGATSYTYNGTPQGPNTASVTGSTGAVTYSYAGTGATSYPASATRPANAGTYTVTATVAADANYNGASSTVAFTINKAGQTVSFTTAAPANPVIGGTYTPAATATSGLAVAITLDAASTGCSLANGVVTFTGAGTCVLNANQGGNGNYNAAAQAQQSIGIGKGASTVTITGATSYTYNGTPQGPNTATVTGSTGAVTYSYAGTGATSYPASATRPANAGTYTVTATVAADANYNGASSTVAFTINKATPVITWSAPAPVYVGTALGAAQLNAAADLAGTFVYTPAAGTVLNTAGDQTLKADFTPADTDNYNSASASVTLTVNTKTNPVITWANPADIVYGTPLSAAQLNAVADVAGSFSYSPAAGAKLNAGAGQILTATFTPADTAKYNSVSKTVTINVAKATPVITWSAPAPVYVGTALGAAQLNATADVTGTFAYTPAAGTVLDTAGDQTLKADFTPADTDNYNNVTASVNLSVTEAAKTTPTITWPLPAAITYGSELSATQLNATASVPGTFVYTPAAGTVLNAGTQTLSVTFTPDDSTHYTTATASVPLTVNKATAVISLGDLSHTYSGSAKSASAITTPAGLTVNLTYNGNAAAPVTAGNYAVVANIDDANYIGSVTGTMVIAKATPVITWATPAAVTVGTSLSSTQLNAIANVAGVFAYTPAAGTVLNTAGSQTLTAAFKPTDSVNYTSATASITLSVLAGTTNQAPVIISQPVTSAYKDGYYFYQVIASDPNGDPILYSLPTRPSGMTINATTGIISWRPQERGSYSVTVKASDPSGLSSSQSFKISVVDRPSNSSPRITSSPVTTASVETPYSYDVEATDSNGDVLFYTLSNKPSGMTIDLTTGLINWTPSSSQAGSQYVKVDVVDSKGGKTSQSFYITVSNTTVSNNPPVFTSTPVITASVKKYYVYDVNAVDPDGDAIKYSLAKKPDGMTINSSTGLVYWYASRSGSFDVSIKATDSKGNSAYQNFTITVGTASGGVSASSVSPCDVTGDGLVTIADIQKIITGRGANDLSLDIDGDGEVTLLDSRRCVTEMQN